MRNSAGRRGFSLIEIMIVVTIILVIATIAIPHVDAERKLANEVAAVRMVQTIHTAQAQHYAQFGKYADSLAGLGPGKAGLIPASLAGGRHSGYLFALSGGGNGYTISAVPTEYPKSGRRTFFSDETAVLRQHWGSEPADASSEEAQTGK